MAELLVQGGGVGQQTDGGIQAVHDTDAVSLEFVAVDISAMDAVEQANGGRHVREEAARRHQFSMDSRQGRQRRLVDSRQGRRDVGM